MACSSAVIISRCLKSTEKLLSQTYPDRDADISHELAIIKVELDKELAIRVHAGKEVRIEFVTQFYCLEFLVIFSFLLGSVPSVNELFEKNERQVSFASFADINKFD